MNDAVKNTFIFVAGAAIGAITAWKILNVRYEQRYQEAVRSTKETYSRLSKTKNLESDIEEERQTPELETDELPDIREYAAKLKEEGYVDYSKGGVVESKKEVAVDRPYVISPEEFGEFDNYERISLTYYADFKLADENDDLVDDVDEIVGEDSLTHFGEFEDDSVFVRNDAKKCDYEILLDQRNYLDVIKTKPRRYMED